jgi:hypothetical protein
LPLEPESRNYWIREALQHSTKGLAKAGMSAAAANMVLNFLKNMVPGSEKAHLVGLLSAVDFRGSDVRLESGTILEGARQPVPYPAIGWDWKCIQSYPWQQSQHINVLELVAFFNFLKRLSRDPAEQSQRFFHVLDSRVSSCVLAKGRSSSKLLNRCLRRVAGFLLASDLYVLPLWTISSWNFSDAGSRSHVGPANPRDAG